MPWKELKPMDLKVMFIAAYLAERDTFSQLCRDYQVSRKTGYDWTAVEHRKNQKEFRTAD